MTLIEKLSTGPVISLVAAVATAVAAVSNLAASIGLRPFWADVVASSLFLALAIYWLLLSVRAGFAQ